ncbi:phosphotransferase [Pseudarthrobacter sp. S9]|uniref:phosphotransferase n=1 Tax=Pseudarthrobacter sp. S9 TaxID=3418421 RepID=UPI003D01B369
MNWLPPVPMSAIDASGQTWEVHRAWPDFTPGDYILEVLKPGRPGVQGARLRDGRFELLLEDDPGLPALRTEARHGEIVSHRPGTRAVIRAEGCFIKIFKPGDALLPAERCAQTELLLDAGSFSSPTVLRSSTDVIVFSAVPGRTLGALGEDHLTISDESFAGLWEKWSDAWAAQVGSSVGRSALAALPVHSPEVEAADLWRWVNRWLRHYGDVPEASLQGDALCALALHVTHNLLRTPPDPLVWAHGDLHDKQILAVDEQSPLGLLDFDDTAQAEAALDLANLDVHLELHTRRKRMTPARFLAAHAQVMATAEALHVSPDRFRAYSDGAWLRLACSPLPVRSALALAVLVERTRHDRRFSDFVPTAITSSGVVERRPAPQPTAAVGVPAQSEQAVGRADPLMGGMT